MVSTSSAAPAASTCPPRSAQPPDRLGGIPVGSQQVRTQVADGPLFPRGRQDLDHAEQVADCLPLVVRQDQPHPVIARRVAAGGPNPPGAVHPQMRVDRRPAVHPDQQVLAAGNCLGHLAAGEICRGISRDAEVGAGEHPARQRLMQPVRGLPHHITLGHACQHASASAGAGVPGHGLAATVGLAPLGWDCRAGPAGGACQGWDVGLDRRSGPSGWTVGLDRRAGPSGWTVGLDRRAGPSGWTVGLVWLGLRAGTAAPGSQDSPDSRRVMLMRPAVRPVRGSPVPGSVFVTP